ncbi:ATP-binding protein [Gemmata sp. G18]|uniref:ATP-binding protein n=1 Tax=Gemmata palustris TaxID=2822762 RepID=A0ABS5BL26_9BACT|nr:AAA family ATPase [Gemmata palustris]MBP3954192.1 ATP-binding protein [Gemmata palustris]
MRSVSADGSDESTWGRGVLIAMAGLPGSGKSTLASRLADTFRGVVLSKDVVRSALFAPSVLDYSTAQDEIAISAVYEAARYILTADPGRAVFLDGRTFSKLGQLDSPLALAVSLNQRLQVIECVCSDEVARARLEADHTAGAHLAGNRTPDMYARVRAAAVPLAVPRLTLDTGALALEDCVSRALAYLSRL